MLVALDDGRHVFRHVRPSNDVSSKDSPLQHRKGALFAARGAVAA